MKVKASITLSEELMSRLDALAPGYGNRSALIEQAVQHFLVIEEQRLREAQDLAIFDEHAETLNEEALDVLTYQVDL